MGVAWRSFGRHNRSWIVAITVIGYSSKEKKGEWQDYDSAPV